jgi:ATP-dependent DNA helicase PIF1
MNDKVMELFNGSQGIVTGFASGFPIVKFQNGVHKVITPHNWESEKMPNVCVTQLPLILAWAISIHKSQGSTLEMAEIDIGSGIFECGQTYVALSRVKSLEGLFLSSYDPSKIKINLKVREFYKKILV